ncbi:MAG: hypothetical protein Q7R96_06095 [Nanoarchaeota archaeon]|nr:hypothetical protein [Nanoarchaeota archaeon]
MDWLRLLKEAQRWRDITKGTNIDIDQIAKDFLQFSQQQPTRTLLVKQPTLYSVEGKELDHLVNARTVLGLPNNPLPTGIDIGGISDTKDPLATLIILSLEQHQADHKRRARSHLNPLLEKIYTEGIPLLQDFAIHEALLGNIGTQRGTLKLEETAIFPERFQTGPYTLTVTLETPTGTVQTFNQLHDKITQGRTTPEETLLDPTTLEALTTTALTLRKKIGALGRYRKTNNTFQVTTNTIIIEQPGRKLFYLYQPITQKNILVYFGTNPFADKEEPEHLTILDGNEAGTLPYLVDSDIYRPSKTILEQRLRQLTNIYEQAARTTGTTDNLEAIEKLLKTLAEAENYFKRVKNTELRKGYVRENPILAEFLCRPQESYEQDAVIHELLPRLSNNPTVRTYNNTQLFIPTFEQHDATGKKQLLEAVVASTLFTNYQNNDVNNWLYNNYKAFCEHQGITFKVL